MTSHQYQLNWLGERLWTVAGHPGRSRELTPLYVSRYCGPRDQALDTAHEFWELTGVMAGTGRILAPKLELPLNPGTLLLVPPGMPHQECSTGDQLDTIWLAFRVPDLKVPAQHPLPVVQHQGLLEELERLWLLAERGSGGIGPELDGLTRAIVGHFFRALQEGTGQPGAGSVDQAIRHFHSHFTEETVIPALARRLGCSPGYFQRQFKQRTGRTPMAYLSGVRIQHAMHLLTHTVLPVSRVGEMVGLPDPFYFSRCFRRYTGLSPRQFRQSEKP